MIIPKPKSLLDEIRAQREDIEAQLNRLRQERRDRARKDIEAGNRRFQTEEMADREILLGQSPTASAATGEAQQEEGA